MNAILLSFTGYESEYHYGSDFGDSSDDQDHDDDPFLMSVSEAESMDVVDHESDSEFSMSSYSGTSNPNNVGRKPKQPTPEPVWLQGIEVPELVLPTSSDDLLVPHTLVLRVTALYEVLRRFRNLVRLSPFRLEDFCAALMCDEQSSLLSEVHIMLLKAIIREEDTQATHFGPLDQKDSVNISLYLMDGYTWPEVLRSYVASDPAFDDKVLTILSEREYPFCDIEDRLTVLQFLVDQFLITTPIREMLLQEGPIQYDDHCRICHRLGDLLCCETCPAVYHLQCVDPPLVDVPTEDWQCSICREHNVSGVVDCVSHQEKHGMLCRQETLGFDRHGRKYWFVCRRIFVETQDGGQCWYYTTEAQLDGLLVALDHNQLEAGLCHEINEIRTELNRQAALTVALTNENKGNKKSYFEMLEQQTSGAAITDEDVEESDAGADQEMAEDGVEVSKAAVATRSSLRNSNISAVAPLSDDNQKMTRNRTQQLSQGTLYFKLGMENTFKTYRNQFALNVNTLNKPHRNEERDKKRHLSHKFSLTDASEFKWNGGSNATKQSIVLSMRATLVSLEQCIPQPFFHPNWTHLRKVWLQAVASAEDAPDFCRVLIVIMACMKQVIYANVWYEQLGHFRMDRITSNEREEKKKAEKREKREYADEEERYRWAYNFVKYTLGMKHQCWKQKGEEYRLHGQWSWVWLAGSRRQLKDREPKFWLQPHKVMVKVETSGGEKRIVAVSPATREWLILKPDDVEKEVSQEIGITKVLEIEKSFDYIDVSMALTTPGRCLYPKVAKRSTLDRLLTRRTMLKEAEEKRLMAGAPKVNGAVAAEDVEKVPKHVIATVNSQAHENDLYRISGQRCNSKYDHLALSGIHIPKGANMELVNSITKDIQAMRILYTQLNKTAKNYRCYARNCNPGPNLVLKKASYCYSPLCMQKDKLRQELLNLIRKAHSAGLSSKELLSCPIPSMVEQQLTDGHHATTENNEIENESDENMEQVHIDDLPAVLRDLKSGLEQGLLFDENSFMECLTKKEHEIKMEEKAIKDGVEKLTTIGKALVIKKEDPDVKVENGDQLEKEQSNDSAIGLEKAPEESEAGRRRTPRGRPPKARNAKKEKNELFAKYGEMGVAAEVKNGMPEESNKKWAVLKPNRRFINRPKRESVKVEPELGPDGCSRRLYSARSTQGKVYLTKKLQPAKEQQGPSSAVATSSSCSSNGNSIRNKYPLMPNFMTKKGYRSILMLPRYELIRIARKGGRVIASGFNPQSKNNVSAWPYPCYRPLFKTCWLYRVLHANTLNALCLGLRILWTCLRWDDMQTRPLTADGKHQITTENEIVNVEILKHRHLGKHLEKTQYLRRKVIIPLELPKTVREVTSIRSGLRKRKRAESPLHTEPQVSEEWIDEEKMDLWEIRQYGEK